MERTQKIKRNLTFNVVKYVAQLVLQFVLRTILIYVMGNEYNGLNGLYSNIFQFLNLAELGVGSAILFAMYKPIAENDIEKIKSLQSLYKKFYFFIALTVFVIGGILTPFLSYFIKDLSNVPADINIYILYAMFLFNAIVGYFSAHKRSLLMAYERNDVENKIKTVCLLAMSIIQIIVLLAFKNYYLFYAVNISFTIIECVIVHIVANKLYPEVVGRGLPLDKDARKDITKNVVALSMHKIGGAVISGTDNILISAFIGIGVLGAYTNYAFVINSITLIFTILSNALYGSVGNLLATNDLEYSYKKFSQINFIFSIITAFCTICLFTLLQPFINLWTAGSENGPLLLGISTVAIICISFYLMKMRIATQIFKDSAGLFWQDKWKPIVESLVNLGASIGLVYVFGINGIFLGTIISTLVAPFWVEPYVLYKYYFKRSSKGYFLRYLVDALIMLVVGAVCFFTCGLIPDGGIWLLIAKFAVCIVLATVLLIIGYCWTPEFKETLNVMKPILNKFLRKKTTTKIENIEDKNEKDLNDKENRNSKEGNIDE